MSKSGLSDSPFFTIPAKSDTPQMLIEPKTAVVKPSAKKKERVESLHESKQASNHESTQSSNNASMHANMEESIVETIRKAVKEIGKESTTYRFTPEEKKALLELSFTYKVQGYKTSENELARIAINFILEDHKQNGRNSILEKVLQALNK
jgi:hypothetical protein